MQIVKAYFYSRRGAEGKGSNNKLVPLRNHALDKHRTILGTLGRRFHAILPLRGLWDFGKLLDFFVEIPLMHAIEADKVIYVLGFVEDSN